MNKVQERVSSNDKTIKYLWALEDGNTIETVYITHVNTPQICISSQIGCNLKCSFCETGKSLNIRNLTDIEIIESVRCTFLEVNQKETVGKFDLISFAGMGEPLLNFDNLKKSTYNFLINNLCNNISVSTSGIIPALKKLHVIPIDHLFISLHASSDDVRNKIVPINRKYPISELLRAAKDYYKKTKRRISISYLLFDGINDKEEDISRLVRLLDPSVFNIYLRNWNQIKNSPLKASPLEKFKFFQDQLSSKGFETFIMKSKGADIDGGCGQLRSKLKTARM